MTAVAVRAEGWPGMLPCHFSEQPTFSGALCPAGGSGYTPLIYAAREGHQDIVQLLLELGADPDAATQAGRATALHRAAFMGHQAIVQLLLAGGATPGMRDADGQTALHKAVQQGHTAVAAALLAACPELAGVRDNRGRLAADLEPG